MRKVVATLLAFGVLTLGAIAPAAAAKAGEKGESKVGAKATEKGVEKKARKKPEAFFGNAKCPITGNKTTSTLFVEYADPKTHTYGKIFVCCPNCIEPVKKDPLAAYKKVYLDREIKDKEGNIVAKKGEAQDLKNDTCPVMGGKATAENWIIYNGYKISLCCPDCEKTFVKSPEKYLAKIMKGKPGAVGKKGAPGTRKEGEKTLGTTEEKAK